MALGEVMLRLDPGEGRIATTRSFRVVGGRRRVQRRARASPLLRSSHRDRHRARRQPGRAAGRGSDAAGRCRAGGARLARVRRDRAGGPQRAQLHGTRLRRARRRRLLRPRAHRRVAAAAGRRRLGADLRRRRRALVPHGRRLLRPLGDDARGRARGRRRRAPPRRRRLLRPELPAVALALARRRRTRRPRSTARSSGTSTSSSATRRTSRRRSGIHWRRRTRTSSSSTSGATSACSAACSTISRRSRSSPRPCAGRARRRLNDWSAVCRTRDGFLVGPSFEALEILDRVGGGDSFASGLDLRPARAARRRDGARLRRGARGAGDDDARRHLDGDARRGRAARRAVALPASTGSARRAATSRHVWTYDVCVAELFRSAGVQAHPVARAWRVLAARAFRGGRGRGAGAADHQRSVCRRRRAAHRAGALRAVRLQPHRHPRGSEAARGAWPRADRAGPRDDRPAPRRLEPPRPGRAPDRPRVRHRPVAARRPDRRPPGARARDGAGRGNASDRRGARRARREPRADGRLLRRLRAVPRATTRGSTRSS